MMGDTYAKVSITYILPIYIFIPNKIAEIKNEWMRQWARTVLIVERSISPAERLRQQNRSMDDV